MKMCFYHLFEILSVECISFLQNTQRTEQFIYLFKLTLHWIDIFMCIVRTVHNIMKKFKTIYVSNIYI